MRKPEKELLEKVLEHRLVLDIGGGRPWISSWITPEYRSILEEKAYCVDFQAEHKPHVIGDIQKLPFKDNTVDGIICIAVLEHVDKPFKAIDQLYRVLSPGGELFLYVPWAWPYHAAPKDCFRYSIDGVKSLCGEFSSIKIVPESFYGLPPNRVLCSIHFLIPPITWVQSVLFRIMGIPVYLIYRALLYLSLFIFKNYLPKSLKSLKTIKQKADYILVDGFAFGYYALCRK